MSFLDSPPGETFPMRRRRLNCAVPPLAALDALAGIPGRVLLESATPWPGHTLVGAAPRAVLRGRVGHAQVHAVPGFPEHTLSPGTGSLDALDHLLGSDRRFTPTRAEAVDGASPPAAWIGVLGYELAGEVEAIEPRTGAHSRVPDLWFGAYDWLLSWPDGSAAPPLLSAMPLTAGPDPTLDPRLDAVEALLERAGSVGSPGHARDDGGDEEGLSRLRAQVDGGASVAIFARSLESVSGSRSGPERVSQGVLPGDSHIRTTLSREAHHGAVEAIRSYVRAGDLFQANLTALLEVELGPASRSAPSTAPGSGERGAFPLPAPEAVAGPESGRSDVELGRALFERLRRRSPAPYAAFLELDGAPVLSISPEGFLSVEEGVVRTRPIKGTRPRGVTPHEDRRLADDLRKSEKDRAENVMIVDLLRNDLSRIAKPHSVSVTRLLELESHPTVHHLVSEVRAELGAEVGWGELLRATFPGGSITGAPKVRALEVLRELEPLPRGPYTGAIGWIGPGGRAELSIAIRTATVEGGQARYGAGGGITLASDPEAEWGELLDKARAFIDAVAEVRGEEKRPET
jgi:anthranilate/para-aminobenzoate synthase component I